MKSSLRFFLALTLILCLCSLLAVGFAQDDPEGLVLTKIEFHQQDQDIVMNLTLQNNSDAAIDEFGIAIIFWDSDGYQLFGYDSTQEGYNEEICNWYYTPQNPIQPGAQYATEDVFSGYAGTADLGVAIRYYHKVDQFYVLIPESEWNWGYAGYEPTEATGRTYYVNPPSAVYDVIGDFDLGYYYYLLDDYNAYYYDMNQGGEWITRVSPGTPAMEAGLIAGDLVLFIDGVKPTENMYAAEYGMAAIVSGEKVDFVYERDGVIYTTRIKTP